MSTTPTPVPAITVMQIAKIRTYDVYLYEALVQIINTLNAHNARINVLEAKR